MKKAFDTTEHKAIFKAFKTTGINEMYVTILEDTYTEATAIVHAGNATTAAIFAATVR